MERTEIVAALGPTNTGKTHRAISRMLEHETGMIGLPLRLLAREVYDKLSVSVGEGSVALITGEEKRIPKRPRYFVCTVEAMPVDLAVDFLVVDEVQLLAHPERGHLFTQRLMYARGRKETWFLGSESAAPLVRRLAPTAVIRSFPRYSELRSQGSFSLGTLPRRSAVVAFSVDRVYQLAEKLRARKGGAAVVLGALSPRARNAQVALYQSGEVDYLVATDAIGMGLNLDIDHVVFADTRKFDGQRSRPLETEELAQIAGRAGRYQTDGGFGTFEVPELPFSVTRAIERHQFPALQSAVWRNSDLDFSSPRALIESLERPSRDHCLTLVNEPIDTMTLRRLLLRDDILSHVNSEANLRLLWEVCQIPDYRKLLVEEHANLVGEIFLELAREGTLSMQRLDARLTRLSEHTGDIDGLMARIASVRTFTYVACREAWTQSSVLLQQRTRNLEDQLSDALHSALVERFVERRNRGRVVGKQTPTAVSANARDPWRGRLAELRGALDEDNGGGEDQFYSELLEAEHASFEFDSAGLIRFQNVVVAELRAGRTALELEAIVRESSLQKGIRLQVERRLRALLMDTLEEGLGGLASGGGHYESSSVRGILYQLRSKMGAVRTSDLASLLAALAPSDHQHLASIGVVFGSRVTFVRALLRPGPQTTRLLLLRVFHSPKQRMSGGRVLSLSGALSDPGWAGKPSHEAGDVPDEVWLMLGYLRAGKWAVRVDLLERAVELSATLTGDELLRRVSSLWGLRSAKVRAVLRHLGLDQQGRGAGENGPGRDSGPHQLPSVES